MRRKGDLLSAKRVLIKGYLRYPTYIKFLIALSEVEYLLGNRKEALDAADEASKIDVDNVRLLGQLCRCYAIIGDTYKARQIQIIFEKSADSKDSLMVEESIAIAEHWNISKEMPSLFEVGAHSREYVTLSGIDVKDKEFSIIGSLISVKDFSQGTIIGIDGPFADLSVRKVGVNILSPTEHGDLYRTIYGAVRQARPDCNGKIFPDGPLQLVKYDGASDGHYHWHKDTGAGHYAHRLITICMGVSSSLDYVGGELEVQFDEEVKSLKMGRAEGIVFASGCMHRVKPVTNGTRVVVVGWFRTIH